MERRPSAIWGGATIGLVVGLILGFFVGTYWMTALYAVLIGAASGVVANILAWPADRRARRDADARRRVADRVVLDSAERTLREHGPTEFETTPDWAAVCIEVVRSVEDEGRWRADYDSLDSFYAAHEALHHPDVRVYAAVRREIPWDEESGPPNGIAETIPQRIAQHRAQAR